MRTWVLARKSGPMFRGIRIRISKHLGASSRLTGMQGPVRTFTFVVARSVVMVALAVLLILVLLPAALAAQAVAAV